MKAKETVDFFSVHSREEVAEIDKRIEKKQKEYNANSRVMADFGMFSPLTHAVDKDYQEFAIVHLLRELGFRKESPYYIVKPKGLKPVKFKLNRDNFWHVEHHDFNGDYKFYPSMGQQWTTHCGGVGTPYYQPFGHEGNIYTVPSIYQLHEFCCKRGFACYGLHRPQEIIRHLVFMYRTINNEPKAFRKYEELFGQNSSKEPVKEG